MSQKSRKTDIECTRRIALIAFGVVQGHPNVGLGLPIPADSYPALRQTLGYLGFAKTCESLSHFQRRPWPQEGGAEEPADVSRSS